MARRAKKWTPKAADTSGVTLDSGAEITFLNKARKQLLDLFQTKGPKKEMYSLSAPITAPIKLADGKYKQSVLPLTDYMFSSAYFGKRGDPIFNFLPADAQDFAHMELPIGGLGKAFPSFVEALMDTLIEADPELDVYRLEHELPNDSLIAMVGGYLAAHEETLKEEAQHAEVTRKAKEEDFYKSNESWGLF